MPHQMEALAETFNPLLRYSTYLFTRTTASSCLRPVVRFFSTHVSCTIPQAEQKWRHPDLFWVSPWEVSFLLWAVGVLVGWACLLVL